MRPTLAKIKDYLSEFGRHLFFRLNEDDIVGLSAQCSYFLFLSLFPFIIFLFSLLSFTNIPQSQLMSLVFSFFPTDVANVIRTIIENVLSTRNATLLTVGALMTIWSSSSGINAVRKGLYKAYRKVETRPFWQVIMVNLVSTVGLALILFVTIVCLVSGEVLGNQIFKILCISNTFDFVWNLIRVLVPIITMAFVFSVLYILIPYRKVKFIEVFPGVIFTMVAWLTISLLFSYFVNNFTNYANIYGSISGIIILLIWLNLSCLFLLLGGEINASVAYFNEIDNELPRN
jgi:membrane protein